MNFTKYPMDVQECTLRIASNSFDSKTMTLQSNTPYMKETQRPLPFKVH